MRLFFAIKIDSEEIPEIKKSLTKLKKDAIEKEWDFKFTPPRNLHITLKFLGEIEAAHLERIREIGELVARRHHSFELKLSGLDAFPEILQARVIWAGVQNKKDLQSLASDLDSELKFLNLTVGEAFIPHLTLARLRNPHSVKSFLSPFIRKNFGSIKCTEIGLYKSELQGHYPSYELIESFSLLAPIAKHEEFY